MGDSFFMAFRGGGYGSAKSEKNPCKKQSCETDGYSLQKWEITSHITIHVEEMKKIYATGHEES